MSAHELETAKREGVVTVNLVFRDGGYGIIRSKQITKFGRCTGTDFGNPDLSLLAESFGIRGFSVTSSKDLSSILGEALALSETSLIDIRVDYSETCP